MVKPQPVADYNVIPINGGAIIEYVIPDDENILCITAEYERNNEIHRERSTYFRNSLKVEGFRSTDPVTVKLYTESYDEVQSEPEYITFTPLKALVDVAQESLEFTTTFGGIILNWKNVSTTELSIRLMAYVDEELQRDEIVFSSAAEDSRSYRGFKAEETLFAVIIGDKWKNVSDTIFYSTIPLFEMEVPKPWGDMRLFVKGDNLTELQASHAFHKFFDGVIGGGSYGYLNQAGSEGCSFTFDLKDIYKLSRFKFWPSLRPGATQDVYGNVNITEFEMWGSSILDNSMPDDYWVDSEEFEGTFKEDWEFIGYYQRERLDLQGATDAEIWQRGAVDGDEWELSLDLKPVRYIRFFARGTADGNPVPNNYWQLGELSFFGTNLID